MIIDNEGKTQKIAVGNGNYKRGFLGKDLVFGEYKPCEMSDPFYDGSCILNLKFEKNINDSSPVANFMYGYGPSSYGRYEKVENCDGWAFSFGTVTSYVYTQNLLENVQTIMLSFYVRDSGRVMQSLFHPKQGILDNLALIKDNKLYVNIYDETYFDVVHTEIISEIETEKWYSLTIMHLGSGYFDYYLNKKKVKSKIYIPNLSEPILRYIGSGIRNSQDFYGYIDNFMVFNRKLSDDELFNLERNIRSIPTPVEWFKFNNNLIEDIHGYTDAYMLNASFEDWYNDEFTGLNFPELSPPLLIPKRITNCPEKNFAISFILTLKDKGVGSFYSILTYETGNEINKHTFRVFVDTVSSKIVISIITPNGRKNGTTSLEFDKPMSIHIARRGDSGFVYLNGGLYMHFPYESKYGLWEGKTEVELNFERIIFGDYIDTKSIKGMLDELKFYNKALDADHINILSKEMLTPVGNVFCSNIVDNDQIESSGEKEGSEKERAFFCDYEDGSGWNDNEINPDMSYVDLYLDTAASLHSFRFTTPRDEWIDNEDHNFEFVPDRTPRKFTIYGITEKDDFVPLVVENDGTKLEADEVSKTYYSADSQTDFVGFSMKIYSNHGNEFNGVGRIYYDFIYQLEEGLCTVYEYSVGLADLREYVYINGDPDDYEFNGVGNCRTEVLYLDEMFLFIEDGAGDCNNPEPVYTSYESVFTESGSGAFAKVDTCAKTIVYSYQDHREEDPDKQYCKYFPIFGAENSMKMNGNPDSFKIEGGHIDDDVVYFAYSLNTGSRVDILSRTINDAAWWTKYDDSYTTSGSTSNQYAIIDNCLKTIKYVNQAEFEDGVGETIPPLPVTIKYSIVPDSVGDMFGYNQSNGMGSAALVSGFDIGLIYAEFDRGDSADETFAFEYDQSIVFPNGPVYIINIYDNNMDLLLTTTNEDWSNTGDIFYPDTTAGEIYDRYFELLPQSSSKQYCQAFNISENSNTMKMNGDPVFYLFESRQNADDVEHFAYSFIAGKKVDTLSRTVEPAVWTQHDESYTASGSTSELYALIDNCLKTIKYVDQAGFENDVPLTELPVKGKYSIVIGDNDWDLGYIKGEMGSSTFLSGYDVGLNRMSYWPHEENELHVEFNVIEYSNDVIGEMNIYDENMNLLVTTTDSTWSYYSGPECFPGIEVGKTYIRYFELAINTQ